MVAPDSPLTRWARVINLVLPGGGLIVASAPLSGVVIGFAFAICANFALASILLFPDDFPPSLQALSVGLAAGSYVGAQIRLVQTLRRHRANAETAWRRQTLWRTRELLESGNYAQARDMLTPLADQLPDDLHVTYRLAQVLTEVAAPEVAGAAWQRLHDLDVHGLYRQQIRAYHERLQAAGASQVTVTERAPE
jgi:hypothetical protein